jgi:hypothetical protein
MDAPDQRFYSNAVWVRGGAFDVTLDFGYRAGDEEKAEPLARVAMSYEHVISLTRLLQNLTEQYTEKIGPIPDPDAAGVVDTEASA